MRTVQGRTKSKVCVPGITSPTTSAADTVGAGTPALVTASPNSGAGGPASVLPSDLPSIMTSTSAGDVRMLTTADMRSSDSVAVTGVPATAVIVCLAPA